MPPIPRIRFCGTAVLLCQEHRSPLLACGLLRNAANQ